MSGETSTDGALELISLEVAGGAYCIDIHSVREIRGWTAATPLPDAPEHVLGVMNLRGAVMPVIDMRARLGFGPTTPTGRHVVAVVRHGEQLAGLLVDVVQETLRVEPAELQLPPGDSAGQGLVDALFPREGRIFARLSLPAVLPTLVPRAA